jgi:hypothetical protein
MTQKKLNSRQANWLEEIWCYHHNIVYQRGESNLADPFSRRPDHASEDAVLSPINIVPDILDNHTIQHIKDAYTVDPYFTDPTHNRITRLRYDNGLYYYSSRICIPNDNDLRNFLIQKAHLPNLLDHQPLNMTLSTLSHFVWWPNLSRDVTQYIRSCQVCQTNKPAPQIATGQAAHWDSVSLDFMINLPVTQTHGYDAIAIFVENITKYIRMVPIHKSITGTKFATVFHDTIFRHYGIPKTLFTAKSAKFTTDLWQEFVKTLGTNLNLVTTFHTQNTTQSEFVSHLITYLRRFLAPHHKQWDTKLTIAEFAVNSYVSNITGKSPYFLLYNQQLHIPTALLIPTTETDLPRDVHTYVSRWQTDLSTARETLAIAAPWQ